MSGPPRVRSTNIPAEPATNSPKKPGKKPPQVITARQAEANKETPRGRAKGSAVLSQKSMSASCSSDASCSSASSSSYSRASSSSSSWSAGRMAAAVARRTGPAARKKKCGTNADSEASGDGGESKKKCAWVTPTTDPLYAAFHDEEWGVPVHDDKKLFELLSLSGALAELTWPVILMKRYLFREVFLDFDAVAIAKLNEKKICSAGTPASSLLSEPKLRAIIENARQICKIIEEFGSFDTYIWNFISHKPIVSQFRYSRQVPVKTPKAEVISKDLVRRGFRSVGPTVIYSFMQVAGLTNDHLISCFRFQECLIGTEIREKEGTDEARATKKPEDAIDVGLSAALGDLSLPQ